MRDIPWYLFRVIVVKDDLNMKDMKEDEEEGGVYKGVSDVDGW